MCTTSTFAAAGGIGYGTQYGGQNCGTSFSSVNLGFMQPGGFVGGVPQQPMAAVKRPAAAPSGGGGGRKAKKTTAQSSAGAAMGGGVSPGGSSREDFVYDFPGVQRGSSSRGTAAAYKPSAAALAKQQAAEAKRLEREAEAARKAEKAAEAKRLRDEEKARKAEEAEKERKFWETPASLEMTPERKAMQKILQELFAQRHKPSSTPFVEPSNPDLQPNLWDVHEDFKAGKLSGIAEFAAAVRGVFYKCYYTYGASPDAHYLSKACEKVDLIFEQQVVLLPRSMREQAVMPQPQREVEEQDLADGVERRRSDRARVGSQMFTTQMLVEQEKRRRRGEEERERREERERQRIVAEEWARQTIDADAVAKLQGSLDGVSVTYFCCRHADALGLGAFSLVELETALACFAAHSTLLRSALWALLRLSPTKGVPSKKDKQPPLVEPSASKVAKALVARVAHWKHQLEKVKHDEEVGLEVENDALMYAEDEELHSLLTGEQNPLGDLDELQQRLATDGLAALQPPALLVRVMHVLIEQVLKVDKSVAQNADDSAGDEGRARCLGRDSAGDIYFWFGPAVLQGGRLVALADKPLPTGRREPCARGTVPDLVQPGETIEVEVDEGGELSWRPAQVRRLLRGSTGRFTACVFLPPDEHGDVYPDEDFVECYNASQKDKEWRKMRSKAEIAREKREAAAAAAAAARAASGESEPASAASGPSRQCGRFKDGPPKAAPAPAPAKPVAEAAPAKGGKAKVQPRIVSGHQAVAEAVTSFREVKLAALAKQLKPSKDKVDKKLLEAVKQIQQRQQEAEAEASSTAAAQQQRAWSAAMVRLHRDVHAPPEPEEVEEPDPPPEPEVEAEDEPTADGDEAAAATAGRGSGGGGATKAPAPAEPQPRGRSTGGWRARWEAEQAAKEAAEAAEAMEASRAEAEAATATAAAAPPAAADGDVATAPSADGEPPPSAEASEPMVEG